MKTRYQKATLRNEQQIIRELKILNKLEKTAIALTRNPVPKEKIPKEKIPHELEKDLIEIKIKLAKIESGQTYLTWIIGLCFLLTISIGLGTVWKLFEVVKIVSR